MKSIGIIGLGTLGTAIARGLQRALPDVRIFATTRGNTPLPSFVMPCGTNSELISHTRTVLLCVKPQQARDVLHEIAPVLTAEHCVISACAGVPLQMLCDALPHGVRVARAMPNITCEFNEGVTGVVFGSGWDERRRQEILQLFSAIGEAVELEEGHFDAVTAIAGCGPAYVCVIVEALSDAGVKAGLPRGVSRMMAVQTLLGSTVLLRTLDEHPAVVRDRVTTPGGCTIEGLVKLEEGRLRATLIAAVTAAAAKSAGLANRPVRYVPPEAVERDARTA